jgi:hypothetical protein
LGILTLRKLFVPLLAASIVVGRSWTPRDSPPEVSHVNKGLQETSNCILTGLNNHPAAPTITNSVNIIESGKIQEIVGTSDAYQIYIVRLTAQSDNTEVEVFSVLNSQKFKISNLQSALSPCVSGLKIPLSAHSGFKAEKSQNFTGE